MFVNYLLIGTLFSKGNQTILGRVSFVEQIIENDNSHNYSNTNAISLLHGSFYSVFDQLRVPVIPFRGEKTIKMITHIANGPKL